MKPERTSRRAFLKLGAVAVGALTSRGWGSPQRVLGAPRRPYGERSPFEKSVRYFTPSATPGTASSRTPLQDQYGIITPSSLHFERHHAGVPQIHPDHHHLLVHGLLDRPMAWAMVDLRRIPCDSGICLFECVGTSSREPADRAAPDPQRSLPLLG